MALILQLETATQVCSVALARDGNTIGLKELQSPNIHASNLTLFIKDVMKECLVTFADIDAVAVSKGPGSYTGLRIGVSTAKGLCYALDIPLIGIDTLEMMASGFIGAHGEYRGLICPMIDARRMEVFTAIYDMQLKQIEPVAAQIIDDESYNSYLVKGPLTFFGDGADKCREAIKDLNAIFDAKNYNSAANMSLLAYHAYSVGKFEDVAYFEPFYLKDFVFTTPKKR
ncbi:MAG: tRNA (adenosine(37)-N6)-threonylcarbamoyltransferase complex dimerization subunit type 1 TsaB [Bacteroidota bacterium]